MNSREPEEFNEFFRGHDELRSGRIVEAWQHLRKYIQTSSVADESSQLIWRTLLVLDLVRLRAFLASARSDLEQECARRARSAEVGDLFRVNVLQRALDLDWRATGGPIPRPDMRLCIESSPRNIRAMATRYLRLLLAHDYDRARLLSISLELGDAHQCLLMMASRCRRAGIVRPEFQRWMERAARANVKLVE